jgi:peptide/nickel transport system permease protein
LAYTIRRLLASIPVLIAATFLVFWFISLTPDPVISKYAGRNPPVPQHTIDLERHRLGLDNSFWVQYWDWIKGVVTHGTFGQSVNSTTDIGHELSTRLWVTVRLILVAMILALIFAVISGVLSAVRQYSRLDYTLTFVGFVCLAMPAFWIAVLLKEVGINVNNGTGSQTFFTIGEKSAIPPSGLWAQFTDTAGHMILPTISLSLITYATWSRFQRSSMLEVMNSDYVRLARAKGLKPRRVLIRHSLRTALIPMVTVSALTIATTFGGAIITETVFGWQGMGQFLLQSVGASDRNAVMAWLLLTGFIVIIGNLVADLLYAVLDPRIRYE